MAKPYGQATTAKATTAHVGAGVSPAQRSAAPQNFVVTKSKARALPPIFPAESSWAISARLDEGVWAYMALAATLFLLSASNPSRLVTAVDGRV
jgi:hypothetical protein